MEDYASQNWATHTEYHFADIPIQEDAYDDSEIGANDHDVVHAINAAIAKLKGDPVPAPFSIKDDKEAILLLAHFVGDIHQPLHVGAIYLTEAGKPINPRSAAEAEKDNTRGGNYLFFNGAKLHGEWDAILKSWQNTSGPKFKKLANEAAHVPVDSGPVEQWAAKWATESVVDAKEAFDGIKFKKVAPKDWEETFANRDAYLMAERDMQWERVKQASARLAEIFKEIWP
jgi:hypothetical protein